MKVNSKKIKGKILNENNSQKSAYEYDKKIWKMIKYKDIIVPMLGVVGALASVFSYALDYVYRIQCEKFYNIPNLYFSINGNDYLLRFAISTIIFILIIGGYRYLSSKQSKEKNKDDIINEIVFSLVSGIYLGLPNVIYVINWLEYYNCVYLISNFPWLGYILAASILILMLMFGILFFTKDDSKYYKYTRGVCICFIVVQSTVYIVGTFNQFNVDVKDKRNYEIVTIKNKEYVILSNYGGDMLLVKYEHEDGEPVFITSEYFFKAKTEGVFRYEHLNKEPKIR